MRALTIQQPFASAIIFGPKRVENRPWRAKLPPDGEWIAVHSALGLFPKLDRRWFQGLWPTPEHALECGVILGLMHVTHITDTVDETDPWAFGPWVWHIDQVIALEDFIPCRGNRMLWKVPEDIALQLNNLVSP